MSGPPYDHYHKNCQPAFAYPTVLQTADSAIHVTYDHNRQVAVYTRLSEDWIRGGVVSAGLVQPDASYVHPDGQFDNQRDRQHAQTA